jgi:DNA-binding transcriptional regulator/RsmH inhibitor MraZ
MQPVQVKLDSKGRVSIPSDLREALGEVVTLEQTKDGILVTPAKAQISKRQFRNIIVSKPKRTGRPKNWSPRRMKRIWAEGA